MADLWTEKYKFQHRLQGMINAIGDDIAESLEGALETVAGKLIVLESKAEKTKSTVRKKKYLNQQRSEIERVLNSVYSEIGTNIEGKAVDVAEATPEIVNGMIMKSIPRKLEIRMGVPKLDKKRITSWFNSSQVDGLYFVEWLKKLESSAVSRIVRETRESMILSEPRRLAVKRIQNALDVGRKSAEGLAHNALHQAHVWAEREYFLENADRIKAVRFVAELDRKTTPLCASLDGKEFSLTESPTPPLHWRCRSSLLPIFKNEALNRYLGTEAKNIRIARIDTEGRTVKHRDGTTSTKFEALRVKHPHADVNYRQWMKSMVNSSDPRDVSFAKEALGPTRFKLVRSGKLEMQSLYYHGKLRTIKELKRLTQ